MALNFPANPSLNDEYIGDNNVIYKWDGYKWVSAEGVIPERLVKGDSVAQIIESGTTGTFEVRVDNKQRLQIIESGNTFVASGTAALLGVGADAGSVVYLGMGDGTFSTYATLQLTSAAETKINLGDSTNAEQLSLFYNQSSDIFTISEAGTAFLTRYQGDTTINNLVADVDNSVQTDPIAVFKDTGTEVARFDNGGSLGLGTDNPQSTLVVQKTLDGGRGAELSLVNLGNTRGGPPAPGTSAAINFGLDNSTYHADNGNAQIRAYISDATNAGTEMSFYNWNGTNFVERLRIQQGINANNANGLMAGRDLVLQGNTGGIYGNRLLLGTDTSTYSLQDGNLRPTVYLSGQYPKICINSTTTFNVNHGPTLQFTCNGVGNQFVIGTGGTGNMMTIGWASDTNWNEHNGISGYNGTSAMGFDSTTGYTGIGYLGDWGPAGGTGSNQVSYPIHMIAANNATNGHGLFFDNQVNAANNGSGACFRNLWSNHSLGIVAEFRVEANGGTDRPSILFSSGYNTTTYSVGYGFFDDHFRIKRNHGHRNISWGTELLRMDTNNGAYFIGPVYQNQSDQRFKTNLQPIDNALSKLQQISGYYFNWDESTNKYDLRKDLEARDVGVVAQEVQKVLPEVVSIAPFDRNSEGESKTGENYLTVRYEALVPLLIEAIKEQQGQIDALKAAIAS